MHKIKDPIDAAIKNLGVHRTFRNNQHEFVVACLLRQSDWKPLDAEWWKGKEVYIIGADLIGNFFLRHCDGSVRYWNHETQSDQIISKSVQHFVDQID